MEQSSEILNHTGETPSPNQSQVSYCSLCWLFMIGSVVGFVIEGLWCVINQGVWENHSATVWGPFCIIYGIGATVVYLISTILKEKNAWVQFLLFSLSGTIVEYVGSLFQELVFGSRSWDYSDYFLNLNGRICLQMTIAWGILGVVFVRFLYPVLARLFDKMKGRFWNIVCVIASVLMLINLLLSAAAVMRWNARLVYDQPATNVFERYLDSVYGNDRMEEIYSNMEFSK